MRLDQIMMNDFIEIYCGNYEILSSECNPTETASNLILEYKMITDPVGSRSAIYHHGNRLKNKAKILLFQICINLLVMNAYDEVMEILKGYGYAGLTKANVESKVKSLLNSAKYEGKRIEDSKYDFSKISESEIRAYFNKEIAFLMTFFKMPLDVKNMSASVYANIVYRACEQIKNFKKK